MTFDPYNRTIADEMSKDLVCLHPEDSVLTALQVMEQERVSTLPVIDKGGACVGILSPTDLIAAMRKTIEDLVQLCDMEGDIRLRLLDRLLNQGVTQKTVADLMTESVKAVNSNVRLAEAGKKMLRRRVHHLPVVDDGHRVLGLVSTLDLLAAFVKAAD